MEVEDEEAGGKKRTTWAKFVDPLQRHQVADTVAEKMGVPVEDVFPATLTTAFGV